MDTNMPPLASIGIDIGKEVFHIVGFSTDGRIAFRRKIKRLALVETFKKLPPSVVGMEACLSAHFVSRALRQLGHEPRIIPAIYVKPFVKGQKNDYNDAEAIAEASRRVRARTNPDPDGRGARTCKGEGVILGRKPKLTTHQRKEAIARREAGEVLTDIARSYNVSHSTISRLQ
jgi:transposase